MGKKLSGLIRVEHATAVGGSYSAFTGKIGADSSLEVPNTESETTTGLLFGGGQVTAEILFMDFSNFATVKGWMENDEERSFKLVFADGTELETKVLVQPFAERQIGVNARDGVVAWALRFEYFHNESVLEE